MAEQMYIESTLGIPKPSEMLEVQYDAQERMVAKNIKWAMANGKRSCKIGETLLPKLVNVLYSLGYLVSDYDDYDKDLDLHSKGLEIRW